LLLGGVGQPLSLLLKCSPLIDDLALYDVVNSLGVAADLNHLNTGVTVRGYLPANDGLRSALKDADVVFILAGIHQKVRVF
jgi:malate dehydrogenase